MGAAGEDAAELDGAQGYVLGAGLGWVAGVGSAGWAAEFGEERLAVAATRTSLGWGSGWRSTPEQCWRPSPTLRCTLSRMSGRPADDLVGPAGIFGAVGLDEWPEFDKRYRSRPQHER
jgi:hypothetical protein